MDTVIIILGVFLACVMLGLWLLLGPVRRRDVESRMIMFEAPHERRRAELSEFPGLNAQLYEQLQTELEACGFRYLGDVEDMTLTRTRMNPSAPVRYMLSEDGTTTAAVLQLRFPFWTRVFAAAFVGRNPSIVTLQMLLADGRALLLQRSTPNLADNEPPEILTATMEPHFSVKDLIVGFNKLRELYPDGTPLPLRDLKDVLEGERHLDKVRREYRLKAGLYTVGDLMRQGSPQGTAEGELRALNKLLAGHPVWDPALRPKEMEDKVPEPAKPRP